MTEPKPAVVLREDGTGSLHPCSPDDPGAIPFISLELAREISSRNVSEEREGKLSEIERLRGVLVDIEFLTATGDGLTPDQAMNVHLLAAEGRAHEPIAWRFDPRVVKRVHELVHQAIKSIKGKGAEDEHEYILADLVPQWQPIETAPKDGTPVDLWFPHLGRCENEWYDNGWLTLGTPTHWMPLPPPPQEGE